MDFRTLTIEDFESLYELYKTSSNTLGLMPKDGFKDYLEKGGIIGGFDDSSMLVGYLMFGVRRDGRVRIAHLCVAEEQRGAGLARALFQTLVSELPPNSSYIKVSCRKDYEANRLWPKLEFFPIDEKKGNSQAGHLLQIWLYDLHPQKRSENEGLSLWQAQVSEEKTKAVIDAQILFDLDRDEETDATLVSKALLADHLAEELKLYITEEMFTEIFRHSDGGKKEVSKNTAGGFTRIEYRREAFKAYKLELETLLPHDTESEISDIRHLAMTAASDISIFITRDAALLEAADQIGAKCGVKLMEAATIISQIDKIPKNELPSIGRTWRWVPLSAHTIDEQNMQLHGESKGRLHEKLNKYKSLTSSYSAQGLLAGGNIIAIKVEDRASEGAIKIVMARALRPAAKQSHESAAQYLVASSLMECLKHSKNVLSFEISECCAQTLKALDDSNFAIHKNIAYRFIIPKAGNFPEHKSAGLKTAHPLPEEYISAEEASQFSAPFLFLGNRNNYIIPIKPGYAMSLFDQDASANDMFGGIPEIFTRWDNTYYRSNTHRLMLKAQGRIFWYVSSATGIVAISHLDEVEVGLPKILFAKNKKRGILNWREIYKLCKFNVSTEIMALNFSHTFQFLRPIRLEIINRIFAENQSANFNPVGPIKISQEIAQGIFESGYPNDES